MPRYAIHHRTHYRYARPVSLGAQRLMVRPKDSHDLRLEEATLTLSPEGRVRWSHDVFGNSIATVTFGAPTDDLLIVSDLVVSSYRHGAPEIAVEDQARLYPFVYAADDRLNLGSFLTCRYAHCLPRVTAWAQSFVTPGIETMALLRALNADIRARFRYNGRDLAGVQSPSETLSYGSGTCRDFATLFIEAARALGIGARFVTGYLYDPSLDRGPSQGMVGAGATHAWAEVYLPGPGWIEFDPTNGLIDSPSLLRVGVASDAEHAVPVSGTYFGTADDVSLVDIDVKVTALPGAADVGAGSPSAAGAPPQPARESAAA